MVTSGCGNLNKTLAVWFLLGVWLSMSACGSGARVGQEEPITASLAASPVVTASLPSESAVPTHTPSNTPAPSLTPNPTNTAGPSPTPIPTPAFGSAGVGNDFLFGNQPDDCELPCWQRLRVGQSDADDIQRMFETAFGFSEFQDMVGDTAESSDVPGMIAVTQVWTMVTPTPKTSFYVSVWLGKDAQIVEAIELFANSPQFERYIFPRQVLRKLGVPSNMLVRVDRTEKAEHGVAMLMMFYYDKGITVIYNLPAPIDIMNINDSSDDIATLCLGKSIYGMHVYLTKPLNNDLDTLSPLQQFLFGNVIEWWRSSLKPFEDVFDISLEEVTRLAEQQTNPCVSGTSW